MTPEPQTSPLARPTVSVAELAALPGAIVIDVREPDEIAEVRVTGSTAIPMSQFGERANEVPLDATVYVVCKLGGRSAKVVDYLNTNGWDAVNVDGGTDAWVEAGYPVERG